MWALRLKGDSRKKLEEKHQKITKERNWVRNGTETQSISHKASNKSEVYLMASTTF